MEGLTTEQSQTNNHNIGMDVIYRTLPNLKTENQDILAANYKLAELHYWVNHEDEMKKYLQSLLDLANARIQIIHAFIELYNGVLIESKDEKNHIVKGVGILYDALPEESKQKVCEDLLGRKKFYEDACVKIMDSFNRAVEVKGDVGV